LDGLNIVAYKTKMDAINKQTALIVGCLLVSVMVISYIANQPDGEVVDKLTTPAEGGGLQHDDEQPASQSGSGETPTQYANGTSP